MAEQDSVLARGPLNELVVVSAFVVGRIDAQEAKPAGQRAEVHVQQEECRSVQGLRPGPGQDGERSELSTYSRTGALGLYLRVGMEVTSIWRHLAIEV